MKKSTLNKLSPALKKLIIPDNSKASGPLSANIKNSATPVSQFAERTLMHCNGGSTMQAALWLKNHLKKGGKLVVTLAGALSSFQVGVMLAELIRQNKVHLVSATGANHEESYYRYVAHSHYAYIPRYTELTPEQEAELRDAGLRRITDTFLPEDESVRIMEPHLLKMWKEAQAKGESYLPHEYFRRLFKEKLIKPDAAANPADCWTLAAYEKNIPGGSRESFGARNFFCKKIWGIYRAQGGKHSHCQSKRGDQYQCYRKSRHGNRRYGGCFNRNDYGLYRAGDGAV